MGRAAYIRRRLILMAFVLFGVTVVIFGMVRILPGDPAFLILGDRATDQKAAELRQQLGLNRPFLEQYWMFVSGFAHGDMGQSLLYRQPVGDLVLTRVPITLALAGYAMGLAAVITLTFGIVAAVNKGRWPDQLIRIGFLFALTTPNFWFGILLILLFGLTLHCSPRGWSFYGMCCETRCFRPSLSSACSSDFSWEAPSSSKRCSPCQGRASS